MKTEKDKEIDDLFKKGLEPSDTHSGYMEGDWSAMEQMLDGHKKRPVIIYWLPILGSVAALLLLVIGWWLLKPVATRPHQKQQMAAVKAKTKQGGIDYKRQLLATNTGKTIIDTVTPDAIKAHKLAAGSSGANIANNTGNTGHTRINGNKNINNQAIKNNYAATRRADRLQEQQVNLSQTNTGLVAYSPAVVIDRSQAIAQTIQPGDYLSRNTSTGQSISTIKKKNIGAYRPQLAITVLAASDKNSVGSFQQAKPGNDAGLLFSVGISKRFTISTGAIYASKQYVSSFANYHTAYQFQTNPISVLANCKMFDIPLNIDYKVFNTYHNKISIGTGISSYLMLHESYQYNYAEYGTGGPARYNVPNPDKYLLSIVNLQATYTRQINSNVGITLQPYMKLPLSAVGASQVRLQSTGVAVGLTWNLNSSSKP